MGAEILRLGTRILLSNVGMLRRPYKLNFAMTYRCNSRCRTCGIWKKRPVNELSLAEIEQFSEKNRFFSWLNLTGGEPFLRKDIAEVASSFVKSSDGLYLLNITTNGLMPKAIESRVSEILSLNIPRFMIVVSLDGHEKVHDNIRGVRGVWKKAIGTFRLLKDLSKNNRNFNVFFGYTICPYNLGEFEKTFQQAKEEITGLKPEKFHVNLFHTSLHYYSNTETALLNEEAIDELDAIRRMNSYCALNPVSFVERNYIRFAKDFLRKKRIPLPCKSLKTSVFLDPAGNVYPCTIFGRKLGNIRDTNYNLAPILSSERAAETTKDVGKNCPQCWTPCEAYQSTLGNMFRVLLKRK